MPAKSKNVPNPNRRFLWDCRSEQLGIEAVLTDGVEAESTEGGAFVVLAEVGQELYALALAVGEDCGQERAERRFAKAARKFRAENLEMTVAAREKNGGEGCFGGLIDEDRPVFRRFPDTFRRPVGFGVGVIEGTETVEICAGDLLDAGGAARRQVVAAEEK